METRNEKTRAKTAAVRAWLVALLPALVAPAQGLQVEGFTSAAVQEAVSRASAGDTLVFPGGEYLFTETVVIDRSITLLGAAELVDVGEVEPGEPNDPPYWDSPPSVCYTEDSDLDLFHVASDAVTFESLKLVGAITHEAGTGDGIAVVGHDQLEIGNCEITRFRKGIDFMNSRGGVVTGSYLHENYRNGFGYGVSITGTTMATGGSEVAISRNEFTFNRHSIASNSPQTRFTVENNYFHDNDLVQWQACVDTHPQGGSAIRAVVRDNIFERTRPMAFKSGSLEITGNYFDPGCGDYSVGGYSRMLDFGNPTHNGNHIAEAVLHNIYIGDNVNATDPWRRLLWVDDYDYEGETKFVAYNLFVDGTETAWEADGRDRIHLTARFRVSDQALGGRWRMFGYARDQDGNLPVAPWHELLEGWPIEVDGHVATSITSAASDQVAPQKTRLDSIYPNPFNPVTTIHFTLSEPQHVTLSVHTLTGQLVETLFSETRSRGSHSATWDASDRASGVYLCRLTGADQVSRMQKMVLIK